MGATIERSDAAAHTVRVPMTRRAGWEQWFLLTADEHFDHPACQRKLVEKHLRQCQERDGYRLGFGDLFCSMQGKGDKRSRAGSLRAEHRTDAYTDAIVNEAAEFYAPYAPIMLLQSPGNHESKWLERDGITDLTLRFIDGVKYRHLEATGKSLQFMRGTYGGWVLFRFFDGKQSNSRVLYYHHGSGGGGQVSRGVPKALRKLAYVGNADIMASGHIHEAYQIESVRSTINGRGRVTDQSVWTLQLPTYKREWVDGDGYHTRTEKPPKPLGGWWVRFYWSPEHVDVLFEITRTEQ